MDQTRLFRLQEWWLAPILFLSILFTGPPGILAQPVALRIGLSKTSPNYENWLKRSDPNIIPVNLYLMPIDSAVRELNRCAGLLLTGGEDVYPGWYGKEADTARCTDMNRHRDSLEMALIARALVERIPVFAVCRGEQILNVFLEGSLIIDIPQEIGKKVIHQSDDYLHCFHPVTIPEGTLLSAISKCDTGRVASNHHQAVGHLSTQLRANAFSPDNLTEGFEWKQPKGKTFLVGVQWHPERMEKSNPLSGPLADEFTRQARLYAASHSLKTK
ncbi:MAG: gamma-glutamyl-gamma-aminobutyrate hydrolase family protein [Bacteroidota bacterium]